MMVSEQALLMMALAVLLAVVVHCNTKCMWFVWQLAMAQPG